MGKHAKCERSSCDHSIPSAMRKIINELTSEMICNRAKGYAFCLMSSWSRLADSAF